MSKFRKKKSHQKAVVAVVAGLSAVAVASVGFSSWIINASTKTDTVENIHVAVAEVTDKRFAVDAAIVEETSKTNLVTFGASSANDDSGSVQSDDADVEDMSFQFTLTISHADKDDADAVKDKIGAVYFALTDNESGTLKKYTGNNYVDSPLKFLGTAGDTPASNSSNYTKIFNGADLAVAATATTVSVDGTSTAEGSTDSLTYTCEATYADQEDTTSNIVAYKYTFTFTFGWGSVFNHQNPSAYGDSLTDTSLDTFVNNLKTMVAYGSVDFTLNVLVTPASSTTTA